MKIALVIGHRAGSQGYKNVEGISEFSFWKTYLHTVIGYLPAEHEYKIFERYDDAGRGYTARIKDVTDRLNEWEADFAISFHFNAFNSSSAEGFEILTTNYIESRELARELLSHLEGALMGDNRGNKIVSRGGRGYLFLKPTICPSMIIEPFFGSSKDDTRNFLDNIPNFTNALYSFFKNI